MRRPAKKQHVFRVLIGLLVFCWVHMPLGAVQPYEPNTVDPLLEPWRWSHIEALDGLGFQCMAQEPNGTMWFGLKDGVMRYDGLQWQRFSLDDGLTPWAKCILAMPDGRIYVQTAEAIHLYRDHQWITVLTQAYSGSPGQSMTPDDQGGIWAACDQGLVYIKNGTARFVANIEGGVSYRIYRFAPATLVLVRRFQSRLRGPPFPDASGILGGNPIHPPISPGSYTPGLYPGVL